MPLILVMLHVLVLTIDVVLMPAIGASLGYTRHRCWMMLLVILLRVLLILRTKRTALGWSFVVIAMVAIVIAVLARVLCLLEVVIGGSFRVFLALVELALEHLSELS